jgi:hypothetical protein
MPVRGGTVIGVEVMCDGSNGRRSVVAVSAFACRRCSSRADNELRWRAVE